MTKRGSGLLTPVFLVICLGLGTGWLVTYQGLHSALLISVLALGLGLLVARLVMGTWLSPPGIFAIGWVVPSYSTLLLARTSEQWALKPETWVLIGAVAVLFTAGSLSTWVVLRGRRVTIPHMRAHLAHWPAGYYRRVVYVLTALGGLGFLINISRVMAAGGVRNVYLSGFRSAEAIFGANTLTNYLFFLNGLVVILAMAHYGSSRRDGKVLLVGTLSFLMLFGIALKSAVLFPFVIGGISMLLQGHRLGFRKLTAMTVIVVVTFTIITWGRGFTVQSSRYWIEVVSTSLESIIYYVAPNYANLQLELESRWERTYGLLTFGSLRDLVNFMLTGQRIVRRDPSRSWYGDISWYLVRQGNNMGTFLREVFIDFGWVGILTYPVVLGSIATAGYVALVRRPTTFTLVLYSVVAMVLFAAFWANHLLRIQYMYWVVVAAVAHLLVGLTHSVYWKGIRREDRFPNRRFQTTL